MQDFITIEYLCGFKTKDFIWKNCGYFISEKIHNRGYNFHWEFFWSFEWKETATGLINWNCGQFICSTTFAFIVFVGIIQILRKFIKMNQKGTNQILALVSQLR